MVKRFFRLSERGATVSTEAIGGLTTFITMSYVIFVQPAVLAGTGMDFGSVMTATCIASAVGCILMGLLANLPIAQAPAMGHNFFFTFTVCGAVSAGGYGFTWQAGLGAVFLAGALMMLLAMRGMRDSIVQMMPESLKYAIPAGIGLFITLIGMQWGGVVVHSPGTLLAMGSLTEGPAGMVMITVLVIALLMMLKIRGAIIIGTAFATVWGLMAGYAEWHGFLGLPASIEPTLFSLDIAGALRTPQALTVVFIFFILDLFDTIGTLTAVCSSAGLIKNGRIPNAREALISDGGATVVGSLLGTTTITSYIESAAGVAEGSRTGLSSVVTGGIFLLALFLYPLAQMIGGGYEIREGVFLYPVIAPALITVGSFMLPMAARVKWDSPAESVPAFLTIVAMPFTFSVTEGISLGIISYSVLHSGIMGQPKASPIIHFLSLCFIIRYLLLS